MNDPKQSNNEKEGFCAVCKSVAKQKCSACKLVYYCNREHQKLDWKVHSKNCRTFKLVEDPKIGRRYVATRQIEPDELVICENKPLVETPHLGTKPICLNCYVPLTIKNAKPCKKCGWPLCPDCTKHGPECELTIKYRKSKMKIQEFSVPNPLYEAVSVMRVLAMRAKNPADYQKFMSLEDHREATFEKWKSGLIAWSVVGLASLVKQFMNFDDLDSEEIERIFGIIGINGFENSNLKHHRHITVYYRASYIEHDCHPNCRINSYDDANTGGRMLVRAIKTIPKGHPITITYTDCLWGTAQRREVLKKSKFFDCTCKRCKDPTEFGTMFSAVKCFNDGCSGYMLPSTFVALNDEEIPNFICDKCNLETPSETIGEMMSDISAKYSKIDRKDENVLKKFIDDHKNILHTNHFHIFNAEMALSLLYTQKAKPISLTEEFLKKNLTLCKKLIRLIEILGPIEYATRGTILYTEYYYLIKLSEIECLRNPIEFLRLIKESKEVITECYHLMIQEPKKEGGGIADLARAHLAEMSNYL